MVGSNNVNSAVGQSILYRGHIGGSAQWRVNLSGRIVTSYCPVIQAEVVRRDFGGNFDASGFSFAYQLDGTGSADVSDVQAATGFFGQKNISGHHHFFRGRRYSLQTKYGGHVSLVHCSAGGKILIFTVGYYSQAEHPGILHGPAH
ncbi:MAG: hypothetical protein A4E52_02279 [Pelotomaculum sp. PtaB.Bin013]|nr:MAG: hypothetical protein A4E52_02279 [Pelotomaculum sp. PtaB.Bin013]